MIAYFFGRFLKGFLIILALLTILSIVLSQSVTITFLKLHIIVLNQMVYYIPHAILASIIISLTLFLYKKNDTDHNKIVTSFFSLSPIQAILLIIIIGLIHLAAGFFLREYLLPLMNVPEFTTEKSKVLTDKEKKEQSSYQKDLNDVADYYLLGQYNKALSLVHRDLTSMSDSFLSIFFEKIIRRQRNIHENKIDVARKKIRDFSDGIGYFRNKEYKEAIHFFKSLKQKEAIYFANLSHTALDYSQAKKLKKRNLKVKALMTLGDLARDSDLATRKDHITYLKKLNYAYPGQKIIIAKLKTYNVDVTFFGELTRIMEKSYQDKHPLKSNIYMMDNKIQFVSKGKDNSKTVTHKVGKGLLVLGQIFSYNGRVYIKDILLLPIPVKKRKTYGPLHGYYIAHGLWQHNKIFVKGWSNLTIDKKTLSPHLIPNRNEGTLLLSRQNNWDFKKVVFQNKVMKFTPEISLSQLNEYKKSFESPLVQRITFPLFQVFYLDRITYYFSSVILLFIISFLGYAMRVRNGKTPFIVLKLILAPFLMGLTVFLFYSIKELCLLFMA